jgi:hypothetical protein
MVTSTPKRFSNINIPQVGPLFSKNLREMPSANRSLHLHHTVDKNVKSEELEAVMREKAKLEGQHHLKILI